MRTPTSSQTAQGLRVIPSARISGKRYPAGTGQGFGTNGTCTLNKLFAVPFWVGPTCSFDRICLNALNTASSLMRVGIYADGGGRPGVLIVDAGQINTAVNGMVTATIALTLSGLVWVAAVPQSVTGSVTRLSAPNANQIMGTADTFSSGFNSGAYSQAGITGALPDPWGSTYTDEVSTNTVPALWLRAA